VLRLHLFAPEDQDGQLTHVIVAKLIVPAEAIPAMVAALTDLPAERPALAAARVGTLPTDQPRSAVAVG
jgi:hypothetical protein